MNVVWGAATQKQHWPPTLLLCFLVFACAVFWLFFFFFFFWFFGFLVFWFVCGFAFRKFKNFPDSSRALDGCCILSCLGQFASPPLSSFASPLAPLAVLVCGSKTGNTRVKGWRWRWGGMTRKELLLLQQLRQTANKWPRSSSSRKDKAVKKMEVMVMGSWSGHSSVVCFGF